MIRDFYTLKLFACLIFDQLKINYKFPYILPDENGLLLDENSLVS